MKRMTCYAIALILMLGFTQCKKEQLSAPENEGNTVMITLDVNGNNSDDSRVDVNTANGHVSFEIGDVIHVVSGGQHVGTLERTEQNNIIKFRGSISSPKEGEPLYFYFLGNKDLEFNEYGTGCTVDISDQRTSLPLISMGQSTEVYTSDITAYASNPLRNQCALVEFTTNDIPVSTVVTINGMKNKVNVDFINNTITPSDELGYISLYGKSTTSRWAILLPQEGVTATATAVGYSTTGNITVPTINRNKYLPGAVSFEMEELAFDKRFSVSPIRKVYFSPGNLQYYPLYYYYNQTLSSPWRFAEHQWDFVGGYEGDYLAGCFEGDVGTVYDGGIKCHNVTQNGQIDGNGWIDLFCWGRWTGEQDPLSDPGWGNIGNEWSEVDFVPEIDGYHWRTMGSDEWTYLLDTRDVVNNLSIGARYTMGTIAGTYKGLILFPDVYVHPTDVDIDGTPVYNGCSNYTALVSSTEDWAKMEAAGAMFLPVAGNRLIERTGDDPEMPGDDPEMPGDDPGEPWNPGGGVPYMFIYASNIASYWTKSYEGEDDDDWMMEDILHADVLVFFEDGYAPGVGTAECRDGYAVRLVRDAE